MREAFLIDQTMLGRDGGNGETESVVLLKV